MDFVLYEIFDASSHFEPTILDGYPNLLAFQSRIQMLPTVAAYIRSDKFLAKPFHGPMAYWRGN